MITQTPTETPTKVALPTNTNIVAEKTFVVYGQSDVCTKKAQGSTNGTIVFIADWSGTEQIYMSDLNTEEVEQITDFKSADISDLSPAPNGLKIVFVKNENRSSNLYILDVPSKNIRLLLPNIAPYGDISWSPDGQWLAFGARYNGFGNLFLVKDNGSGFKNLTNNKDYKSEGSGLISPSWSPDGKALVFNILADYDPINSVYLAWIEIETSSIHPLGLGPDGVGHDWHPQWNPIQGKVLYIAKVRVDQSPNKEYKSYANQIAILDVVSKKRKFLTSSVSTKTSANWSPDGKDILYLENQLADTKTGIIYSVHLIRNQQDFSIYDSNSKSKKSAENMVR